MRRIHVRIRCAGGTVVDKSFYHRKTRTLHGYRRTIILRTFVKMYSIPTCRNGKWREERPCIYIMCKQSLYLNDESRAPFYAPIDVYTILSGYELYEIPDPIGGGGEWFDKYGGVLPLPWM